MKWALCGCNRQSKSRAGMNVRCKAPSQHFTSGLSVDSSCLAKSAGKSSFTSPPDNIKSIANAAPAAVSQCLQPSSAELSSWHSMQSRCGIASIG